MARSGSAMRTRPVQGLALTMAGWLFADVLLVLFVVGMGSAPTVYPEPTPSMTTPTPTPTATPSRAPALAKKDVKVHLTVNLSDLLSSGNSRKHAAAHLRNQVTAALKKRHLAGERAGMVLVWAYDNDSNSGVRFAQAVANELPKINKAFFGDAAMRTYWNSGRGYHGKTGRLEIFVLK